MGVFATRPSLPRYNVIWDVNVVLDYIATMETRNLLQLSGKLCMLFLLLTAQRCQTLHLIELEDISFQPNSVTIFPTHMLKQTKPSFGQHCLDKIWKQLQTIYCQFDRTNPLRESNRKLLISTQRPHHAVSSQTVSRWVKNIMIKAGISEQYSVHSTRAAATSAAKLSGVALSTIIRTAGWKNAKTFARFYHRSVEHDFTIQNALRHW